ncbi:Endonuclease/exonuclease/phosphatase superfamily [Arabidopsis suecica]|uniref:Endonuclease/exonuclease/phosphatase superfamily n=1 Tax=Arabidopsis suecica TaxID=45249 RepID=A0A8T2ADF5_ARASU|nr:Endonuclease/exonuclease/phosphatase superfamily [Arabidopsis suecica]
MEEMKELELLEEGETVEVPDLENEDLIEENSMSVIVRCLNPSVHKVGGLVKALPPIWGLEDRVRGRGVGEDRVQFIFESEGDLYHLKERAVKAILEPYGKVDVVELHAKNSPSLEYVRARTWINADEPLQFVKNARFSTGEVSRIELTYEKLIKVCFICKRLTHDQNVCPLQIREESSRRGRPQGRKQEVAKGKGKGKAPQLNNEDTHLGTDLRRGQSMATNSDNSLKTGANARSSTEKRTRTGNTGKKKTGKTVQEWRPKAKETVTSSEAGKIKPVEDVATSLRKRRRSRSGEKTQHSPSVFERLGSSNERSKDAEQRYSNEKGYHSHSPSVFERLGSQGSSSSSIMKEKTESSNHSGHVAAQLSSHSASSVAANRPHSSGVTPESGGGEYPYSSTPEGNTWSVFPRVEPRGKSGGLALLWKDSVQVKVLQSDKRMIDTQIKWQDKEFYLTCIYGEPVQAERGDLWERLTRMGQNRTFPWMLTGDFNELVDPTEKIGGPVRKDSSCVEFRQMLISCGLWEVKHSGYQFSWYGNRNDELVQCRLDRTVANQAWMEMFPQAKATYLQKICSDHSPLVNSLVGEQWKKWAGFKYDKRWIKREGFKDMISQFWSQQSATGDNRMMAKIASCRKEISRWKRATRPNSAIRLQELQFKIDAATKKVPFNKKELASLKRELNQEYINEEQFWKDKSRITWMNNGDRNTKYFHAATKNRRAQNRIQKLIDDDGREWTADVDLGRVAEVYFKRLFASEDVGYEIEELEILEPSVTEQMNSTLLAPVTKEEVKVATFSINPYKCPGPDGMNGFLYQQFWDNMGDQLTGMVQTFFNTGILEEDMNKTNICLIPKKLKAEKMVDFRPISLCNIVYKVIGKLLASRLKKILPSLISESQEAFVQGRLISDNILIAHELLHALSSSNKCSEEFIAIKTDISKAYDRVEWPFLEKAMQSLGFADEWIQLIMACVKSVKYQVLINGAPYGEIIPTRGLRQGDPLSPYLFVICTEMLVKMLQRAEQKGLITGLKVARGAPPISHLLFADDSMFYCKEKDEELNQIIRIIEEYSLASGQRVNYQKSSIHFGKHIPEERRSVVKMKLGIDQEGGDGIYLGLPESFQGSKVSTLRYIKERLGKKVNGWQSNFLSPGGKEVLLKAVAMALPTYTMTCFKLPKTVCQQIESTMADFWWKNKHEGRGMHWKAWSKLSQPKAVGGLGFKDIEAFNVALLGKQLWRMITKKESLMAKIFKSRYFSKSDPLNAPLGSRPSYAWKSIHEAQVLIKEGIRAVVGNGRSINIWKDPWVSSKPAQPIQTLNWIPSGSRPVVSSLQSVSDLVNVNGREWNQELLNMAYTEEIKGKILEIRPGAEIQRINTLGTTANQIWKTDAPPKIHHFLWRCLSNSLSVAGNLSYRHLAKDKSCIRCPSCTETVNHLLFKCSFARLTWAISPVPAPPEVEWSDSLYKNLHHVLFCRKDQSQEKDTSTLLPWILWRLWKNRNGLVFQGKEFSAPQVVNKAKEDEEEWQARKDPQPLKENKRQQGNQIAKWKPPPQNWVKCNVDGTWTADAPNCGVGWVTRDHRGKVLWMGQRALPRVQTVLETELEALRWAVLTMSRFNYRRVIFESDSQHLVSILNDDLECSNLGPRLQDIRNLLQHYEEVQIVFTRREGNKVADRIARESLSLLNYDPKLYSLMPDWVKNLVVIDSV